MEFSTLDIIVFFAYCLFIIGLGLWVSREKKGHVKDSQDYFLASKSLPWWAIGSSLIASNISAEQIVAMSGSGFVLGLGIATYELMAAATLIIVGKYFLPIFLKEGVYTMPQFLEIRYDKRVRTILAIFWLLVYIFVNLTSVLYLGAISFEAIAGVDLIYGIIALATFSALYSIYGGLKAVAWTDVVQVFFLVVGGLITTYLAVAHVGDGNFFSGFDEMLTRAPEKFNMILSPSNSQYINLPGISILIGGMWITNLNYWGCNQYITQRALAGKTLKEAQKGIAFAGYLKIFMPLIVVIPGIAAFLLAKDGVDLNLMNEAGNLDPDKAYPALLTNYVPSGLKGVAFAALIAAIVSSLSSMINSTSTIFTMDLYRNYINKNASENQLVFVGRVVAAIALVIAILVAPSLSNFGQAFQYIQEFTGFVSPAIVTIFLFGLFWKKATAKGGLWSALVTILLSFSFYFFVPQLPFLDRMLIVFIIASLVMIFVSVYDHKVPEIHFTSSVKLLLGMVVVLFIGNLVLSNYGYEITSTLRKIVLHAAAYALLIFLVKMFKSTSNDKRAINYPQGLFITGRTFNIASVGIVLLLVFIYATFW